MSKICHLVRLFGGVFETPRAGYYSIGPQHLAEKHNVQISPVSQTRIEWTLLMTYYVQILGLRICESEIYCCSTILKTQSRPSDSDPPFADWDQYEVKSRNTRAYCWFYPLSYSKVAGSETCLVGVEERNMLMWIYDGLLSTKWCTTVKWPRK
jgi:hypothetical protein